MKKSCTVALILAAVLAFGSAGTSYGGYVTLINSNAFGRSWDYGPDWSDGQPAGPGNDYHVGDSTGKGLRTPNDVTDPVFPGDSLWLHGTGTLGTKHRGTCTIADLHLDGGTIGTWVGNRTMGIGGAITVESASTLDASGSGARTLVIAADIAGNGLLRVSGNASNGTVRLTGSSPAFFGGWTVASGLLDAQGAGSLGLGSVTVNSGARLDIDYAVNTANGLTLNGQMVLDQDHTLGSLIIGGKETAAGTFSFAQLDTAFDAYFADGGSGSITVTGGVPAGTVYELNATQPMGQSWNNGSYWTNTSDSSTGTVPAFGTIANVSGRTLRTPTSSDLFAATLNLQPGGAVLLKTSGTATLADCHLLGGSFSQGIRPNSTGTIGGNVAVDADSRISINSQSGDVRTLILAANLSGTGQLTIDGGNGAADGTLRLTGSNSAYAGDWDLVDRAVVLAEATDSLGSGSVNVQSGSRLDVDYNLFLGGSMISLDGVMVLDQDHVVGDLVVGGTILAGGTYSYDTLNATYDPFFADGGSGSITVLGAVPAYELNKSQPMGNSWNTGADWTNLGDGTTGTVPPPGSLAFVRGKGLRTPTSSATFSPELFVMEGGTIILKTSGTATLANAHLNSSTIGEGIAPNSTGTIAGNIEVLGTSTILLPATATDTRTLILPANLSGDGRLTVDGGDGNGLATLRLSGDNSGFSGDWVVVDAARVFAETPTALGAGGALTAQDGLVDVADGLTMRSVIVGLNGGTADLVVHSGAVQIGSGSGDSLFVGRRTANVGSSTPSSYQGTLDLSDAASVTVNVGTLGIAYVTTTSGGQAQPRGIVTLSPSNTIVADSILVAESPGVGLGGFNNQLVFGAANTVQADAIVIGGSKGVATASIMPGGVLDLAGKSGARADLTIGRQGVWTAGGSTGTVDMTGGTFNAMVNQLVIGSKFATAEGTTSGTLTMAAGVLDANDILLADHQGTVGTTNGTLNFSGGTIATQTLRFGAGNATLNWTGGTLAVGTAGEAGQRIDLLVPDGGRLAPLGAAEAFGDYLPNAGAALGIEIADLANFDSLDVHGLADLAGYLEVVLTGAVPPVDSEFLILRADQLADQTTFAGLDTTRAQVPRPFYWELAYDYDADTVTLALRVPEPTTLALLGLPLALLARRRRRA